ncbi:MAG TPA: arginase [Burkholderiales bacterium]|nr:arginase [Burkholderiales bacterium]
MQRQVQLIGAAWGLGGADPGCAEAPAVLAPLAARRLEACGVGTVIGPLIAPAAGERRKTLAVSKLCGQLASAVADARREARLPCVLGGDHSCAGGTWSGVARTLDGALGLVWIDAHMDSHTPSTSHTGRLHGMPLAWLLGQADDPLYGLASGVLKPEHVCLVGVRSYEPEEDERLRRLGVRVVFMDEVRARGIDAVLGEAIEIARAGTTGFGVSIDLDVVSPDEAPNVGTPVSGGVTSAELARSLEQVAGEPSLAALELVEYSPRLDRDGATARVALSLLSAALCGTRQDPQVLANTVHR